MDSDISTIILAIFAGVAVFTIYMAIDSYYRKQKQSQALKGRVTGGEFNMGANEEELLSHEKTMSPTAESLTGMLTLVGVNEKKIQETAKFMKSAGFESPDAPVYYLFAQRILSILFVLVALPFLFTSKSGTGMMLDVVMGLLIMGLGVFGPKLYINNTIAKRKKALERSFPDALDLMLVCVESGLALDASLSRVCRELGKAHPLITKEFNRTRMELALLNDRSQALMNLGDRTDLVPFRSLAATLIQTEKFGTSLTETLRVLSDDYRQTRLLYAENKANKLPALITIPLITLLMPAFILIIIGPAIIKVRENGGLFGG